MTAPRRKLAARRQEGSSLIVSIVLLVVLTLIVLSAIKSTIVDSKVAGNLQVKREAEAAAQQAIESVIASSFQAAPVASIVAVNVSNAAVSSSVGQYTVTVAKPSCLVVVPIKTSDLNVVDSPDDIGCLTSSSDPQAGSTNGDSACATRQWDIQATATPTNGGGPSAVIHQGISERVAAGAACAP
jgi:hypothetical protein